MVNAAKTKPAPIINRLVVVGLGLIGGSFAKGLRESGLCREVVGVDLDAPSRKQAVALGVVDRCEEDLATACVGADVIQLAVPILAMEKVLARLARLDLGNAIITDVGSAKGNVVREARSVFVNESGRRLPRFVPGHPIAGSEQSGVEASNATLFRRHKVILTPLAETDPAALALVDRLWRALEADVEHMTVERHDEVLAATSHLPHLLAFGLVDSLAKRNENLEIFRYAAGGSAISPGSPAATRPCGMTSSSPTAMLSCAHLIHIAVISTPCATLSLKGTGTSCWVYSPAHALPASISVKSWPVGPMWTL